MNWPAILSVVVTICIFVLTAVWRRQTSLESCLATKYCTKETCRLKHKDVDKRLDRGGQKIEGLDLIYRSEKWLHGLESRH